MFKRSLGLVIAGLIASGAAIVVKPTYEMTHHIGGAERRRSTISAYSSPFGYKRNGPGWTAAHVKRMAKKTRNQKRHRKAVKGGAA